MGTPLSMLEQLRAHLVANTLVRLPDTAGAAPVCVLPGAPDDGTPLPPDGEQVLVELEAGPRVPGRPFSDKWIEHRIVHVIVRSRSPWPGELLQREIAALIVERRGEYFADLRVEWCRLYRGDQVTGTSSGCLERTQSFSIAARVKSLAGNPYAP